MTIASGFLYHQFELVALQTTTDPVYTYQIDPFNTAAGQDYYPTSIGSRSTFKEKLHPSTGQKITGWKWGERSWTDESTENLIGKIPVCFDPTTSGLENNYFQSGIGAGNDLELKDIIHIPSSGILQQRSVEAWCPEINHGYFYQYQDEYYLYSDNSEIVYPTYSGTIQGVYAYGVSVEGIVASGFNKIDLLSIPKTGIPITGRQFIYDRDLAEYQLFQAWRKVSEFTGIKDASYIRADTINDITDAIIWDSIDRTEPEFYISYSGISQSGLNEYGVPTAVFNDQCVEQVGGTYSGILFSGMDIVGISDGNQFQQYHTTYSPIDSGMQVVVFSFPRIPAGFLPESVLGSGVDGSGIINGGFIYSGLITEGFLDVPVCEWITKPSNIDIHESTTSYQARLDYDLGILYFGDPVYSGVVRVPPQGDYIGISYWKTVRVEYEPQDTEDYIYPSEVNLNPVYRKSGSGWVFISNKDQSPITLTLEAELPSITTDVYGPLYIGGGYAGIVGIVKDQLGNPLEDQEVTFTIRSNPTKGGFGTSSITTTTAITDDNGEARVYYTAPRSINDLGIELIASDRTVDASPSYPVGQTTTFRVNDIITQTDLDKIFLYKILLDDASLGYLEASLTQTDYEVQLEEYYRNYFLEHNTYGLIGLANDGSVNYYAGNTIWEDLFRTIHDLAQPTIFHTAGTGYGKKVLCTVLDSGALNPHTFQYGAWAPIVPIDVVQQGEAIFDVVYDTTIFNLPVPSGSLAVTPSGNLYGYFLVSPSEVSIQASTYNEKLQKTIFSNEITITLDIPEYMSGVWSIDELNQVHIDELSSLLTGVVASGQKLPLGFRLKTSNLNMAAALDAVTFLDVNPEYNANIWDVEVVQPLRHKFNITSII